MIPKAMVLSMLLLCIYIFIIYPTQSLIGCNYHFLLGINEKPPSIVCLTYINIYSI